MEEDLKPIDLCLAELKPDESWVEDRTVADLQIARMNLGIGVKVQSRWAIAGSA